MIGWELWLHLWAPGWLAQKLSENYSDKISFEKVSPGLLTSLKVSNVKLKAPVQGEIKTLYVSIQPWALFSIRPQSRKLFWIRIEKAEFHIHLNTQPSSPSKPIDLNLPGFPFGLKIKKSNVTFSRGSAIYPVSSIDGIIGLNKHGFDAQIKAKVVGDHTVFCRAKVRTKGAKDWTGNCELRNFPAKGVFELLQVNQEIWGNLRGKLHAEASFQLKGPFVSLENTDWNFYVNSENLFWQRTLETSPVKIDASVSINKEGLSFNRFRIDEKIDLAGQIKDFWDQSARASITFHSSDWPLENLQKLFKPESSLANLSGNSQFDFRIEGPLKTPEVNGTFEMASNYGPLNLPKLVGKVIFLEKNLNAEAQFSGGQIKIWTERKIWSEGDISIFFNKLSLQNFGRQNNWKNVTGDFNAKLHLHFSTSTPPELVGVFNLANLTWGRNKKNEVINGRINLKPDSIDIDTVDQSLTLHALFDEDEINLKDLKVVFGEGSALSAKGKSDIKQGKFNYFIEGTKIQPDIWPPLVAQYPDITGNLDFSGKVFGVKNEPELHGSLLVSNLQLIPQGGTWNGTMELDWTQKNINLRKVHLDGGYHGEISVDNKDGKWSGEANLVLDKSKPQLFTDIFKTTYPTKGFISGLAQFKFKGANLTGISSVTWSQGEAGAVSFDEAHFEAKMKGNKFSVQNLKILNGPRALRGWGECELSDTTIKFDSELQLHQFGNPQITVDGEIHAQGQIGYKDNKGKATIKAPNLWINGFSLYDCFFNIRKDKEKWLANFNLGDKIKGSSQYSSVTRQLKGGATISGFMLEEIIPQFVSKKTWDDWPQGLFTAKAGLSGSIADPKIKLTVKSPQTTWQNEKFSAQMIAEINSSTMIISALKASLESGGTIYSTGTVLLDDTATLHLEGAGTNLKIQTIFNFIDWPISWDGKTDGTFLVEGPSGGRTVKFTFAGKHKGFEPFDGDGNVSGAVRWKNYEWDLSGIRVDCGSGYAKLLEGSKVFRDLSRSGKMRLVVETRNIKSGIITLFGQFEVFGKWEADKMIAGSLVTHPIELDLFARPLWINQFVLEGNVTHMIIGDDKIQFSPIYGSEQQLSGTVEYPNFPAIEVKKFSLIENGVEKFFLDGAIGKNHWDFSLKTKGTDASTVVGLIDLPFEMSGLMDIQADGKGNSQDPKIDSKITWRDGTFGILPLDLAHFRFSLKDGVAEIFDLSAYSKKGYYLTGDIRFGTDLLPENKIVPPTINLKITKGNMAILESMWTDCKKARGSFEGEINMWEEKGDLQASGFFNAEDVYLKTDSYAPVVKKGLLKMVLKRNKLNIEEGRAQIGKGEIVVGGQLSLGDKDPNSLDLSFKSVSPHGLNIQIPELTIPPGPVLGKFRLFQKELAGISKGELKFDLSLKGPFEHPVLKGNIDIENALFTYPQIESKEGEKQPKTALTRWFQNFMRNLDWDLSLDAGNRTMYENELVFALLNGSLVFRGPSSDLNINGRITSQQGSLVYAGNEFKINNAVLEVITEISKINSTEKSQTLVYLTATAERDVVYVDVSGNSISDIIIMEVKRAQFGEIQPRFYSKNNPELSSQKALMFALGFSPTSSLDEGNLFQNQSNTGPKTKQDVDLFLRASLVQLLDSSFASPLARTVARRTGLVDTIRVTYQAPEINPSNPAVPFAQNLTEDGTTATNPQSNQWWRTLKGTKVKLGRELYKGLYADYSFKFDEFENQLDFKQEVELAYRLQQNLFIRATTELDSQRTLGRDPERKAMLEKRWRFGLPKKSKSQVKNAPESPPEETLPSIPEPKNTSKNK